MKFSIDFPVKPHLHKYLSYHFGNQYKYKKDCWFASIIESSLIKNRKKAAGKLDRQKEYCVIMDSDFFERQQITFNVSVMDFNNRIERFFREELFLLMRFNKALYNIKYLTSFRDYMAVVGITEEDINFESLQRHFKRKMNDWEQKNTHKIQKLNQLSRAS